jgi:hypothetical protein
MKDTPLKFATVLQCPNCGQRGARHWEEGADHGHQLGSTRVFVNVSSGFRLDDSPTTAGEPKIVCDICDEIQPD